jgi:hypothetical protein
MKRLLVVVASTAVLVVAGASGAIAGEVKGPPNDFDSTAGQTVSQVQTAADSWKYYGFPKGAPGTLGLCQGGTGQVSHP